MKLIGATFTLRDDLILSDRLTVPFKKKIGGLGGGRVVGAGGGGTDLIERVKTWLFSCASSAGVLDLRS